VQEELRRAQDLYNEMEEMSRSVVVLGGGGNSSSQNNSNMPRQIHQCAK
jgi:hypothetical protein